MQDLRVQASGARWVEEPARWDLQGGSKPLDCLEAHVAFATFGRADVGAVQVREFRQLLLGEGGFLPIPFKILGKHGDERLAAIASRHDQTRVGAMPTIGLQTISSIWRAIAQSRRVSPHPER